MAAADNTDDMRLLLPSKNGLHEALENGRYKDAWYLIRSSTEDYLTEFYENCRGYSPPSYKSCLHIIAALRDKQPAVFLYQEFLARITTKKNRDKLLNATVVQEFGTKKMRARVAAVHIAAYSGNTGVVRLLCQQYGVDANCSSGESVEDHPVTGITPLYWAAANGQIEVVKLLIDIIGDVNARCDDRSDTALHIACWNGQLELVKWLLAMQVDVIARRVTDGATPLYDAAESGHVEVVRLLLDHEADVNASRNTGSTPLYAAAQKGHVEVVRLLLNCNVGVNLRCTDGYTALLIAAQKGHVSIVKLLLENKADVNVSRPGDNATSLYLAAWNGHVEVVKLLLTQQQ